MKKLCNYIQWIDSGMSLLGDVWQTKQDLSDIAKNMKLTETVGFVVYEDDEWVALAQTTNDEQIRGGYFIYKRNIRARYPLRVQTDFSCGKDVASLGEVEFELEQELKSKRKTKQ